MGICGGQELLFFVEGQLSPGVAVCSAPDDAHLPALVVQEGADHQVLWGIWVEEAMPCETMYLAGEEVVILSWTLARWMPLKAGQELLALELCQKAMLGHVYKSIELGSLKKGVGDGY